MTNLSYDNSLTPATSHGYNPAQLTNEDEVNIATKLTESELNTWYENSFMNQRSGLRQRYFEHYITTLNGKLDKGCKYKTNAPFK